MAPPMASSLRGKKNGASKRKAQSVSFGEPTVHTVNKRPRDDDDAAAPSSSSTADNNRLLDDAAYDSDDGDNNRAVIRQGVPSSEGEESENSKFSLAEEDIKFEPFNMNAERNDGSGYFDGDTFVFRRQNADETDAWLDSEHAIYRGSSSADEKKSAKDEGADAEETPARVMSANQKAALCKTLAGLLSDPKETVTKALRRYGDAQMKRGNKKKGQGWKKQRTKKVVETTALASVAQDAVRVANTNFTQVSEIADALMVGGCNDVYELTQAKLYEMSGLRKDVHGARSNSSDSAGTVTAAADTNETSTIQWEYRGNEDGKVHGPFTTEQMIAWRSSGFFVGEQAVDIRIMKARAGANLQKAQTKESVTDDLLADLESDEEDEDVIQAPTIGGGNTEGWLRSDSVNFSSYLLS